MSIRSRRTGPPRPAVVRRVNPRVVRLIGGVLCCALLAACAANDPARRDDKVLRIVDYGLYRPARGVPVPARETLRIPAEIGTRFGFRFRAPFVTLANYRFVTRLPPTVDPATGEPRRELVEDVLVTSEIAYFVGLTIEEDWQAVPGEWQMQVVRGETVLAERTFQLYLP